MKKLGIVMLSLLLFSGCHKERADTHCPEVLPSLAPLKTDLSPVNFIDGEATATLGGKTYRLKWKRGKLEEVEILSDLTPQSSIIAK